MAKYKDLIFPDEKKANKDKKQEAVETAEFEFTTAEFNARQKLREAERVLNARKAAVPLKVEDLIIAQKEVDNCKRTLEILTALKEELL